MTNRENLGWDFLLSEADQAKADEYVFQMETLWRDGNPVGAYVLAELMRRETHEVKVNAWAILTQTGIDKDEPDIEKAKFMQRALGRIIIESFASPEGQASNARVLAAHAERLAKSRGMAPT